MKPGKSALITETIILGNSSNNGKQISFHHLAGDSDAANNIEVPETILKIS